MLSIWIAEWFGIRSPTVRVLCLRLAPPFLHSFNLQIMFRKLTGTADGGKEGGCVSRRPRAGQGAQEMCFV